VTTSNYMPDVKVEVAFNAGWSTPAASRTWTDISTYVDIGDTGSPIVINGGRGDELSTTDANNLTLVLDNSDGRFTPGKASSPYYPNVKLGRPIRVSVSTLPNGTFEDNTTGWTGTNAVLLRSTAEFHVGVASMSLTAITAATMSADTPSGTSGVPVVAGASYVGAAWFRALSTTRTCNVLIDWYTGAGGFISTSTSSGVVDSNSSWTQASITATAPATAAFARVRAQVTTPVTTETHYVDDAELSSIQYVGFVDQWPNAWEAVSTEARSRISATSRIARIGNARKLKSIVEEEFRLDGPKVYCTLGEAAGATAASDSSGNQIPAFTQVGTGAAVVFGSATGPGTDSLTAATFADGKLLKIPKDSYTVAGSATSVLLEGFVNTTVSSGGVSRMVVTLNGGTVSLYMLPGGELAGQMNTTGGSFSSGIRVDDGLTHHVAYRATLSGTTVTPTLFVDGVAVNGSTFTWTFGLTGLTSVCVGGDDGDPSNVLHWNGTIAHAAVTFSDAAVANARIQAHASAGLNGFAGELSGARFTRYASYAGIAAGELSTDVGQVPMAHVYTTDQTALDMMRVVESTEEGVVFDAKDGTLTFHDRFHRYNAVSAFTLDMALQEVEADFEGQFDRTGLANEVTATLTDGKASARAFDQASQNDYGIAAADLSLASTDTEYPLQAASWLVNQYGQPRGRVPSVLARLTSLPAAKIASLLAADASTRFTVANIPSQASAANADYFVEGYTKTIGFESFEVTFNVSDATVSDVWTVEDAVLGQYDAYPIAL